MTSSRNEMRDHIILSLGGRVAEELILDDISTGASNDIQQATSIARNMVTRYGMSTKLGTVLYDSEHSSDEVFLGRDFSSGKNYSEKTAADIDDEIRNIIFDAHDRCKAILSEHIDNLHFVAQFLLKNESMDEEQFKAAMEMENPTIESIEDIAVRKQQISEEENQTAHANNAKEEELKRASMEELAKKMSNGETITDDVLNDIFKNHTADANHDNADDNNPEA